MSYSKTIVPIAALCLVGNAFAAMPQSACDMQQKHNPTAFKMLVKAGQCTESADTAQPAGEFAKGHNAEYNTESMLYAGQFPLYQKGLDEAKKQCRLSGGRLMQASEAHNYISEGQIRVRIGTPEVVVVEGNKLTVTAGNGSWGELICAKEEGSSGDLGFETLNKVTFRESQNYCLDQGKWLLDEDHAKARIVMVAQGVKQKKVKLENTRSRSKIPQLYMAYANSQQDYGYVRVNVSPFIPMPIGEAHVKPINGTKGGYHNVMQTQDGEILAVGQTDYLGLDKYPTEYNVTMTQQGKISGSKDDYFYVFGACSDQGQEIKDKQ